MCAKSKTGEDRTRTYRVLVVDDHTLVAETFVSALSHEDMFAVETAKDIATAESMIRANGRYDVVLLDYELPDSRAMEGLARVMQANSGGVALFSGVANRAIVERALAMGAKGFIPKTLPLPTVARALRFIADGEVYVPADFVMNESSPEAAALGLKPRELKILAFLNEGLQNKEIGREVGIEEAIVKMDLKSICRKLGARNRTQAVLAARKLGIV